MFVYYNWVIWNCTYFNFRILLIVCCSLFHILLNIVPLFIIIIVFIEWYENAWGEELVIMPLGYGRPHNFFFLGLLVGSAMLCPLLQTLLLVITAQLPPAAQPQSNWTGWAVVTKIFITYFRLEAGWKMRLQLSVLNKIYWDLVAYSII